jgi:hypothetical protein
MAPPKPEEEPMPDTAINTASVIETPHAKELLRKAAGLDQKGGNERLKRIVHRVAEDMCRPKGGAAACATTDRQSAPMSDTAAAVVLLAAPAEAQKGRRPHRRLRAEHHRGRADGAAAQAVPDLGHGAGLSRRADEGSRTARKGSARRRRSVSPPRGCAPRGPYRPHPS